MLVLAEVQMSLESIHPGDFVCSQALWGFAVLVWVLLLISNMLG